MARRGWQREPGRHSLAARGVKTKRHTSKSHYEPSDAAIRKTVQLVHAEAKRILAENPNLDWEEAEYLAVQSLLQNYRGPPKSDFLFYTDEDLESIKRSLAKERTFTSLGHDMAKRVEMSQDEAMRILEEWGEVLNPADYSIPIKMARDPKKWYTHAKHTGWRKTQQASTRRAKLLASTPKNWTSARRYGLAGRRAQALANVTQDKQTARLADADAQYFFDKLARLRA